MRGQGLTLHLIDRGSARLSSLAVQSHVRTKRIVHMEPSLSMEMKNRQRGPVNHLDLDPMEERYLLAGAGDATIGLYDMDDLERPNDEEVRGVLDRLSRQGYGMNDDGG